MFNGHGEAEENGGNDGLEVVKEPAQVQQLAPSIEEDLGDAELDNRGQWSPLPLEPEEFEGETPIAEDDDAAALTEVRHQVTL